MVLPHCRVSLAATPGTASWILISQFRSVCSNLLGRALCPYMPVLFSGTFLPALCDSRKLW